ncbi:MAG: RraA family protein [Thermomicrobiales bacterium]
MDELHRSPAVAQIGTGPVSDAMEQLRLPRSVITGWRYINPDPTAALIGPAYTLRQAAKGRAVPHDEDRTRQRDVVGELAQPGDVIVIDVGGRTDVCTWGENHSMRAQSRGIAGLVVHGAVRDSAWIARLGFPVLCRGVSPVASKWDLESVAINEPVTIGGVLIRPGDLIYADADGVIVIPSEQISAVLERALAIHGAEEQQRTALYGHGR